MSRPKQLLRLTHPEFSMLEEAVGRISQVVGDESVFIATSEALKAPIAEASLVAPARLLVEPVRRNTLGALAWASAQLISLFPKEWPGLSLAVVTADHKIGDVDRFVDDILASMDLSERTGGLVTLGIKPTRAETGFGYIEVDSAQPLSTNAFRAKSFREKPDSAVAEQYVGSGNFLWNSGMFFWTLGAFFKTLEGVQPAVAESVLQMAQCLAAQDLAGAEALFAALPNVSIDYAVMEKASNVYVVQAQFPWDDVGAWDALDRALPSDDDGNVISGNVIQLDTRDSIVLNDSEAMTTCVLGLSDIVVVTTKDAVLVCPKSRVQEIRRIVAELKERGSQTL